MNSDIETPINLGNPREYTMIELAQIIIKMSNSNSDFILNDLPEDDPQRRCPDISFAQSELGWTPKINLSEGLSPTLNWFRSKLND